MVAAARCLGPGRLPWPLIGLGVALLGFHLWWPLGVAIVVFLIWRIARMGCGHHRRLRDWHEHAMQEFCGFGWWRNGRRAERSTGNRAFDAYRAETLRRLEEDQRDFAEYLDHLRHAKDQAEFDQFLAERARRRSEGERPHEPPQS